MNKTEEHCGNEKRLDGLDKDHALTRKSAHEAKNIATAALNKTELVEKDIETLLKYDKTVGKTMEGITTKLDEMNKNQIKAQTTLGIYAVVLGCLLTISISVIGWLVIQVIGMKTDVAVIKDRLSTYNITVE